MNTIIGWRLIEDENKMNYSERILEAFKKTQSIKATARQIGCSWNRVAKVLSTAGIIANENQAYILSLYEKGKTLEEIIKITGFSRKTIQAYIPRKRPVYNENLSENALRIKEYRAKKEKQL